VNIKLSCICDIGGSHGSVAEESSLLGFYTVSSCN